MQEEKEITSLPRHITDAGLRELKYPIGENMSLNIRKIRRMSKIFTDTLPSYLTDKKQLIQFWVRGSSGVLIGSIIASALLYKGFNVRVLVIRKPGESSHMSFPNYETGAFNIIVDDFIESGKTLEAILERMKKCNIRVNALGVTGYLGMNSLDKILNRDLKFTIANETFNISNSIYNG